jgi:hypothetical protein
MKVSGEAFQMESRADRTGRTGIPHETMNDENGGIAVGMGRRPAVQEVQLNFRLGADWHSAREHVPGASEIGGIERSAK